MLLILFAVEHFFVARVAHLVIVDALRGTLLLARWCTTLLLMLLMALEIVGALHLTL